MSLDKRICRNYADERFPIRKSHGLLHLERTTHIIRVKFKNISGKRVMLLFLCPVAWVEDGMLKPQFVVYQTMDSYITLEHCDNGKTKWRQAQTDGLSGCYHSFLNRCAFYSHREEQMVVRFCKNGRSNGLYALLWLQRTLFFNRCEQQKVSRNRKIRAKMAAVKPLPEKTLKKWAHWEVLPAHIIYNYQKGKKQQQGFCTHCQKEVTLDSPRHAKDCVCPSCGYIATARAAGRKAHIEDRTTIQCLQKHGEEVLVRICKVFARYRDPRNPEISIWENARLFLSAKDKRMQDESYYYSYEGKKLTPWTKGARPVYNRYFYNYEADTSGHVYTKNLNKELKGTPWQYSQLGDYYLSDRTQMCIRPFFREYVRHPVLEYLIKLRLYALTTYVVYGDDGDGIFRCPINLEGKNIKDVLGVDKQYLPMMQEMDMNRRALRLLQQLVKDGIRPSNDLMLWCQHNKILDKKDICTCLRHMTPNRMMWYLAEQCNAAPEVFTKESYYGLTREKRAFDLYKDYIRFCAELGYDMKDEFILFPRHLKDAHDRAAEMFDKRKAQIYNEKIAAQYEALVSRYQMSQAGLTVIPPKSAAEIVEEGQKLHHCVGGYVSRVAKAECTILFLRREEQPEEPYYTMELRDGEVKQLRGDNNCDPTPAVAAYMTLWKQEKLLPAAQKAA